MTFCSEHIRSTAGLEATRISRALKDWGRCPILALTANVFDEDRRACVAAGMNDFITKPIKAPQLYASLLRWLDTPAAVAGFGAAPRI